MNTLSAVTSGLLEKFQMAKKLLENKAAMIVNYTTTAQTIERYVKLSRDKVAQQHYIGDVLTELQSDMHGDDNDAKTEAVAKLIFLSGLGYDCTWADFKVLEVLSFDLFSSKRIAYTAASQIWLPNSDVVMMATNRIQRDLVGSNPNVVSAVLSAIPHILSVGIAQYIASDVIKLMNSAKPAVRIKAICVFFHICLKYPEALRPGFPILKARLDDPDESVVFAVLTVMQELCVFNPKNFIPLVPKLFKIFETTGKQTVKRRLIHIFKSLCSVETRLPKKLVQPFLVILETSSSTATIYECIKSIIEIPITNANLLNATARRLEWFMRIDQTTRSLSFTLFIKLMKICPKMVLEYREVINECLDSEDEAERVIALDLLGNLVNEKTIDGIVARMYEHFKDCKSSQFRDKIFTRVIEVCTRRDYELICDFDWYITVLMDFVEEGGFTIYQLLANQFLDLATRVPDTRSRLVDEMGKLFDTAVHRDDALLVAAAHIIGEYSETSESFGKILQPIITNYSDRVQLCCIQTAFTLYCKCQTEEEFASLESMFELKLPLFEQSCYPDVQERAISMTDLIAICKQIRGTKNFEDMQTHVTNNELLFNEVEAPAELSEPIAFMETLPSDLDYFKSKSKPKSKKHHKHKHRHHETEAEATEAKENGEGEAADGEKADSGETGDEEKPEPKPKETTESRKQKRAHAAVSRILKRKHRKKTAQEKPEEADLPVTGPTMNSRLQVLGNNSSLAIAAIDFAPKTQTQLEITLKIENLSGSDIPSVDFQVTETKSVKISDVQPLVHGIEAKSSYIHSITLEIENCNVPQAVKMLVVPNGGDVDSIEARLRIFPSYFLVPADIDSLDFALKKCTDGKQTTIIFDKKQKDVIQDIANVMRGSVIPDGSEDENVYVLCAKSMGTNYAVCYVNCLSENAAEVDVKSWDAEYSASVIKEIELKFK